MSKWKKAAALVAAFAVPCAIGAFFIKNYVCFIRKLMDTREELQLGYETALELYRGRLKRRHIKEWFDKRSAGEVYIYGYNELSRVFCDELLEEGIKVNGIVDDGFAGEYYKHTPIIRADASRAGQNLPVIITDMLHFDRIEQAYSDSGYKGKVYSIQDPVFMTEGL